MNYEVGIVIAQHAKDDKIARPVDIEIFVST